MTGANGHDLAAGGGIPTVESLAAAAHAAPPGAVVSIGNFDGVHLGHRALLGRMQELAAERQVPAVVVTFFPPAKVFFTGSDYLSTAFEKRLLLAEFRPDLVVMVPFDESFSHTTKGEFLAGLAALKPSAFVVGQDFRFGAGRAGAVADLTSVAPTEPFGLVSVEGRPVGSTRVRELLATGDLGGANRLLGAPYLAHGTVGEGAHRGRSIGYPTANLQLGPRKALPRGVHAVTVHVHGRTHGGMANVGPRPTFGDEAPSLEVNLFDFHGDLYGQALTVRFVSRLRDQVRFASVEDLKAQLAADETAARQVLDLA